MDVNTGINTNRRIQLFVVLFYLLVCFVVFTFDSGKPEPLVATHRKDLVMLKIFQVLGVFVLFILPAIAFSKYLRPEKAYFLNLHQRPVFYPQITTSILIVFFALPAVAGLAIWNSEMHLPDSMSSFENWMRLKEDASERLSMAFLKTDSIADLITNLLVVAFIAALSEEIFFRGVVQRVFRDNGLNVHIAVWLTGILFSAFHLQFFGFLPRLFLGVVLGYLYAFTSNLWVPIIAHFVNNSIAVLSVHFTSQVDLTSKINVAESENVSPALVGISIVLVGVQLFFLNKHQKMFRIGNDNLDIDR